MRKFIDDYDKVFIDIDDTLIHGWFVTFMHYEWQFFRNNFLSALAMKIQNKLRLYKVNTKLLYALKPKTNIFINTLNVPIAKDITFLTVRAQSKDTVEMVSSIMKEYGNGCLFEVVALGTDNGHEEKAHYIYENYGDMKCLLIDDNELNRVTAEKYGIDTFNPKLLLEKMVG